MIHKGFDFTQLGGMPMNQGRLEWMQAAYAELSGALASLIGTNVIVSGCIVSGNTVTDGWIVVNGELLPFVGTQTGVLDTFLIRQTNTSLVFKDGTNKPVQFSRYAQFGSSSDSIQWNSLVRMASLKDVSAHLADTDNPHEVTKAQVGLSNLPNAKTDDPTVDNSNVLATSAAVNAVYNNTVRGIIAGSVVMSSTTGLAVLTLPVAIDIDKYQPVLSASYDFMYRPSGASEDVPAVNFMYDVITSCFMMNYNGATSIYITYDNTKVSNTGTTKAVVTLVEV